MTENRTELHRRTILKLNQVFSMGYIPSREIEPYNCLIGAKSNRPVHKLVNCFGHACFNLTNQQLRDLDFNYKDADSLSDFFSTFYDDPRDIRNRLFGFVNRTGLKVELVKRDAILKNNQWKVAYYFRDGYEDQDFHFFLQEKDGHWSSKVGFTREITYMQNLQKQYEDYSLFDTYSITNPFVRG